VRAAAAAGLRAAWPGLASGAGLGFLARDLLGLPALPVAMAWALGAVAGVAGAIAGAGARRRV
jgi:hypothetical protein